MSEHATYETVAVKFWPWSADKSLSHVLRYSHWAQTRAGSHWESATFAPHIGNVWIHATGRPHLQRNDLRRGGQGRVALVLEVSDRAREVEVPVHSELPVGRVRDPPPRLRVGFFFKLTRWVRRTNSSTLERKRARAVHIRQPWSGKRLRLPFTRNWPLAVFVIQPPAWITKRAMSSSWSGLTASGTACPTRCPLTPKSVELRAVFVIQPPACQHAPVRKLTHWVLLKLTRWV